MTLTEWDSSVDWYEQNMGEQGDTLNRDVIRPVVLELLGDLSSATLLDCGCGSGYLASELARQARAIVGADFSPGFVALCRAKYAERPNMRFVQADVMQSLPLAPAEVNAVLCKMVLQYVPEIATFAAECRRVLAPGGQLLVLVDHPFHAQFLYAQQLAGTPQPKYQGLGPYFEARVVRKLSLWGKVELTWYPRTVAQYVQAFLDVGLGLAHLRELPSDLDGVTIPRILALHFRKPA